MGGNRLDVALAGGSLTDGPVLLVPTTGAVPSSVLAEIHRLSPDEVVALGGTASVSASTLSAAAGGVSTSRVGSDDVYATTAAIARRAFPRGASRVYLARVGGSPDAVVGGALKAGPVVPVPSTGAAPKAVRDMVAALAPAQVTALGGPVAVSDATLASAAGWRSTSRIAGADRYATSQAVARTAFPAGATVAYLASGASFADAVVGGMLGDGPILLTPPVSATKLGAETATTLTTLGVRYVGTLGGASVVPDVAISAVVAKVPTATTGSLPRYATAPAPTPTPTASPAPTTTPAPSPTPTHTPPPPAPVAPSGSTSVTRPPATQPQTCSSLIATFRPIVRDSRYSIECVSSLDRADTLGVTETWIGYDQEFIRGAVKIRSDLDLDLMRTVIAHELGHAWSYAYMMNVDRQRFAAFVGVSSWDGGDYNSNPAEVWARTQATCVGYPDGFRRKQVTCADLAPFGWRP